MMALRFMEGNEAIARAAILAGCRFFAGYPITPANTIYQHMLRQLPPIGGICLQGEDEIAMTRESFDLNEMVRPTPEERRACPPDQPLIPFETTPDQLVPCFLPIGGERTVRQTSASHGADAYITMDTDVIGRTLIRLKQKISGRLEDYTFDEWDTPSQAEILLVVYGMTGGQCSATTAPEARTASGLLNRLEPPLDICQVAAGEKSAPRPIEISTQFTRPFDGRREILNPGAAGQRIDTAGELLSICHYESKVTKLG
jgi:pyruvate/2-oxoacid:ferredoxin oxidoreductase alpha subunit